MYTGACPVHHIPVKGLVRMKYINEYFLAMKILWIVLGSLQNRTILGTISVFSEFYLKVKVQNGNMFWYISYS